MRIKTTLVWTFRKQKHIPNGFRTFVSFFSPVQSRVFGHLSAVESCRLPTWCTNVRLVLALHFRKNMQSIFTFSSDETWWLRGVGQRVSDAVECTPHIRML